MLIQARSLFKEYIKETLIKSFVHIGQSDFLGKPAKNMQARCANSLQRDLFNGSLNQQSGRLNLVCPDFVYNSDTTPMYIIVEGTVKPMAKILVAEDEENISRLIIMALTQIGHKCKAAFDGESAADMIDLDSFDLILLDIMLPKIDGLELMEYIKNFSTPVIFITAKSSIEDKVKGLNSGADDYITKPFDVAELQARVEAVLRRYNKAQQIIAFDDIIIDTSSRIVTKGGKSVELTLKEYEILLLLVKNKNIALYRETIYERVWKEPFMGDTRTVDLHIQRLRKKLGIKNRIQSVFKVGYRFTDYQRR